MNSEPNPVLDRHLRNRQGWEELSRNEFYTTDKEAHVLASSMLEALSDFGQRISGTLWPIQTEEGNYSAGLVASFIRTHFMVVRCAEHSHLIEGVTLLRKQLEVLARLTEIDDFPGELERFLEKPPNLKVLKSTLSRLYGPYSEIAHSSVPARFHLLGSVETDETSSYLSLYPKFSRNSYVLLHNAGQAFLEFWVWLRSYNERHGEPWDLGEFNHSAQAAFQVVSEWDVHDESATSQATKNEG